MPEGRTSSWSRARTLCRSGITSSWMSARTSCWSGRTSSWISPQSLLDFWGFPADSEKETDAIAPCETAIVVVALLAMRSRLQGRRVLQFVDNTSALYSMVRGNGSHMAVARSVAIAKMVIGVFGCHWRLEFVDSGANWSDGISRELSGDELCRHDTTAGSYP